MTDSEQLDKGEITKQRYWGDRRNREEYQSEFLKLVDTVFPEFESKMVFGHLFSEVQSRPGLALRERSMINITSNSIVVMDYQTVLRTKVGLAVSTLGAINNGVSREEILEIIMHIAHLCGWIVATNALIVVKQIFAWEQLEEKPVGNDMAISDSERFEQGKKLLQQLEGSEVESEFAEEVFPEFWEMTLGHLFGNIWSRPALALRHRLIVSLTANIALKFTYGIERNIRWALNNGITGEEILEIIMIVAHYRGWPTGINAVHVAKEVFSSQTSTIASDK